MKATKFVTALGCALALIASARAPQIAIAKDGADDVRPEVQKPQRPERPEKPGFSAITTVVEHGADDVQPEVPKPQRPEKPGRQA